MWKDKSYRPLGIGPCSIILGVSVKVQKKTTEQGTSAAAGKLRGTRH